MGKVDGNGAGSDALPEAAGLVAVGKTLAAARQQNKLELESVATDLHLRPEVVRALEAGDAASLPADAFVRGYIKSYARLLGLEEGPLLAQLPQSDAQRSGPLRRVGMRSMGARRVPPFGRWLTWGGALLLAVMLVVYGVPMVERLWSGRSAAPANGELELPGFAGEGNGAGLAMPDPVGKGMLNDQSDVDLEAVYVEAETDEQPAAPVEAPQPRAEAPGDAPPLAEPSPAVAPTPEPAAAGSEPDAGPALVELRFIEDSWVEMEARGRKLVVGTQPAGSQRSVRAEPPIQLLLGNAPGVKLSYRGRPVDLGPYQRGKVARLTLED